MFRDVPERLEYLSSQGKRAPADQRLESLFRHRQFVDVAVAGATDDENVLFTLFLGRVFFPPCWWEAMQLEK
jgi:hypothetical protein